MSRASRRASTKSPWRRGEAKQYGLKAVTNYATKSNAKKEKKP